MAPTTPRAAGAASPAPPAGTTTGAIDATASALISLAQGVGRIPEGRDRVHLGTQPLEVVHEAVAAVLGVLEVHPDVDRLLRADLLTVAAEDAAELVDLIDERVAVSFLVL